jgi:hypothetical protein
MSVLLSAGVAACSANRQARVLPVSAFTGLQPQLSLLLLLQGVLRIPAPMLLPWGLLSTQGVLLNWPFTAQLPVPEGTAAGATPHG